MKNSFSHSGATLWNSLPYNIRESSSLHQFKQVGGKRGAGVPGSRGVENTGCGKHGVWWKTRGLGGKHGVSVENTGSKCKTRRNHYFAQQ